jgi:phosphotransferase system enzyme I (PtsP)
MLSNASLPSKLPLPDLLQRIGDMLEKPQTLSARLTLVLKTISQDMDAQTAILYLLTSDRYLEVYACYDSTFQEHKKVSFRVGEGVVGFVAALGKSVICDNISRHPNFLYRPGIADHVNLSLLGVPLIAAQGVLGVLTLQNPPSKPFEQWQETALAEVGSFLAHLNELEHFPTLDRVQGTISGMQTLQGVSFNSGLAIGTAVVHHPYSWKESDFALSTKEESLRLKTAIRTLIESIDLLVASTPEHEQETQEVLASYRMIAADRGWVRKIQEYIQKGFTAEAAVQKVRRHTRERFAHIGDQLLKGRLSDFEDLANRLLKHLSGKDAPQESLPEATILVAHNLGPAELLDYDRRLIKGLVLEEGVHTAHVAIIARSLNIPVVGRIPLLLTHVTSGDRVIVDGEQGTICVNPDSDTLHKTRKHSAQLKKWQVLNQELKHKPCQTRDGVPITLALNAGLPIDLQHMADLPFESVGLYRTEIPFMMRSSFPDVNIQTEFYKDVIEQAHGMPITFRTLDIGGDKVVPYMWRIQDENPVLGWRAIRVALDKPSILRQQARALIRATAGRELRILFPMIADITEYREARRQVEQEWERAQQTQPILPSSIAYGVMVEVPSIVNQLDILLKEVDFISLGTNDLFQFFYACDRTNPAVSNRYDVLSTSFLQCLYKIRLSCDAAHVPLNICGEIAGKPLEALALLALGYRSLSLSAQTAGLVKKMLITLPLKEAEAFVLEQLKTYSPSLRAALLTFAKQHQVDV